MTSRLDHIIATHRATAAADGRFVGELLEAAAELPPPRGFRQALESERGVSMICEIKRRSPSAGDLAPELDPVQLAKQYEAGGTACLSVLTDVEFFGGSPDDLRAAHDTVSVPILRKDFTVSEADVVDARLMGADAVLLIVAALEDDELWRFGQVADRLDLTALFEVHNAEEIERAVAANAKVIGVNQRDLHSFAINTNLAAELAGLLPAGVVKVAESGIATPQDVRQLAEAGYDAALIGTALVTAEHPADRVHELIEAGRR